MEEPAESIKEEKDAYDARLRRLAPPDVAEELIAAEEARVATQEQAAPQKDERTGRFAPGNNIGKQFQPGTSGNPNGRPKDSTSITAEAKRLLAKPGQGNRLNATLVAEKLLSLALAGNVEALRYLGDRTDGKPAQAVTLSLDEGPLHYRLAVRDGGPRLAAAPPAEDA